MKKTVTLILMLVIGSLSLNAQDISNQAAYDANSGDTKLTTFIRKLMWTPLNESNNIVSSYTQMMSAESQSALVYPIREYTYDQVSNQSIFPEYKSTEGGINKDVESVSTSGSGSNAVPFIGCQCSAPGYGCQTSTCAQSCEIYCNSRHGHGHK